MQVDREEEEEEEELVVVVVVVNMFSLPLLPLAFQVSSMQPNHPHSAKSPTIIHFPVFTTVCKMTSQLRWVARPVSAKKILLTTVVMLQLYNLLYSSIDMSFDFTFIFNSILGVLSLI